MFKVLEVTNKINGRNIDSVSFSVEKGTIHALIGPNGAGKSTVIKSLLKTIRSNKVEATFENKDFSLNSKKYAYVSDKINFTSSKKVINYLSDIATINGEKQPNLSFLSSLENWSSLLEKELSKLSAGESRIVAIASAFVSNKKLIFLDEPFANLDYVTKNILVSLLSNSIKQDKEKILILVTHDVEIVHQIADTFTLLIKGQVKKEGKVSSLFIKKLTKGEWNVS